MGMVAFSLVDKMVTSGTTHTVSQVVTSKNLDFYIDILMSA